GTNESMTRKKRKSKSREKKTTLLQRFRSFGSRGESDGKVSDVPKSTQGFVPFQCNINTTITVPKSNSLLSNISSIFRRNSTKASHLAKSRSTFSPTNTSVVLTLNG